MHEPTRGEMELEERSSLRHVVGLSTELQDVTDAEYREPVSYTHLTLPTIYSV